MVLQERIELSTSPLPSIRDTIKNKDLHPVPLRFCTIKFNLFNLASVPAKNLHDREEITRLRRFADIDMFVSARCFV